MSRNRFDDLMFGGGPDGRARVRVVDGAKLFALSPNERAGVNLDTETMFGDGKLPGGVFVG